MQWWYIIIAYFIISTMLTIFAWTDGDDAKYLIYCWLASPIILIIGTCYRVHIKLCDIRKKKKEGK